MKLNPLAAVFLVCATVAHADTPVLTILTYDSFAAEWGPGPAVETAFEATCACDLQFVTAGDGAALLARLQLEGAASEADILLGLDTNLTAAATATGLFAAHGQTPNNDLPIAYADPLFVPYDWGWFAFVYNVGLAVVPASFEELAASDLKIVIQDARSSTPGLGLVMWVKQAYGDRAPDIWAALADNILTVTPGWTESYGLFTSGEADMVLSYSTSPAYHIATEGTITKAAAEFSEGHYIQIEVAGKLAGSDQPALADAFLAFMAGPEFQAVIPETNWMYPAKTPEAGLPASFQVLMQPAKTLLIPSEDIPALRDKAIEEWRAALSQ